MATWIETVEDWVAATYKNDHGKITATRVFKVAYDSHVPCYYPILHATEAGLPAYNSALSADSQHSNVVAVTFTPKYDGDAYDVVTVTVDYEYSTWIGTSPVGKRTFDWSSKSTSVEYFYDSEDTATLNTAGEPYPQNLKRDDAKHTFKMTLNVAATASMADYASYMNKTNQGACTIDGISCGEGTARVTGVGLGAVQQEAGFSYKVLTVEGEINTDGYDQEVDSRGHRELKDGKLTDIMKGNPPKRTETPWPLDDSGAAAANASDDPATTTYKPYYKTSMGSLFA